jgi:uncharacterized protein YutE (UPF0331/DUF86 family)
LVDHAAIEIRTERLDQELATLARVRSGGREPYLADHGLQLQVERALQVAIQACIDIGSHLVAAWGLGPPDDYADVFARLRLSGGLDGDLADRMIEATKQRNMLVHVYLRIDHTKIWQKLSEVDDLRAFAGWALDEAAR